MRRRSAKYSSTADVSFAVVAGIALFYAIVERDYIPVQEPCHPTGRGHDDGEDGQEGWSTTANASLMNRPAVDMLRKDLNMMLASRLG